jgi:hypothetical protein
MPMILTSLRFGIKICISTTLRTGQPRNLVSISGGARVLSLVYGVQNVSMVSSPVAVSRGLSGLAVKLNAHLHLVPGMTVYGAAPPLYYVFISWSLVKYRDIHNLHLLLPKSASETILL